MGKIMTRDSVALSALYDRYARLIYSLIRSVIKNHEEAEDLLQEVFVQLWERASTYDAARGSVYTWIVTLARNRAIDQVRSKSFQQQNKIAREVGPDMLYSPMENSPFDLVVAEERSRKMRDALNQIPPEQSQVIHIAYFGGCSQSEIAAQLNIPLGTVKTRMRQGMKKLQQIMTDR
ncbi:MAG TPA: sigma-70 family RNA polymerase sigma factor [Bacteroidota bacterium]|nr:sigma-70 family RNA polymerase sigma factor [Bacteroidota bacterium]